MSIAANIVAWHSNDDDIIVKVYCSSGYISSWSVTYNLLIISDAAVYYFLFIFESSSRVYLKLIERQPPSLAQIPKRINYYYICSHSYFDWNVPELRDGNYVGLIDWNFVYVQCHALIEEQFSILYFKPDMISIHSFIYWSAFHFTLIILEMKEN